jgi:hypothetical protein
VCVLREANAITSTLEAVCRLVPETLRKLPRQVVGCEGHEIAPDPYQNHMILEEAVTSIPLPTLGPKSITTPAYRRG